MSALPPLPTALKPFDIDRDYLLSILLSLLKIHSPTGYTDPVVRAVCGELDNLGIPYELTRRGAIRASLQKKESTVSRAVVAHVDTLGAMVREIKANGRLGLVPLGNWSSRFAEGARVSIFTDDRIFRGTILPLKASGHVYNEQVDTQPVNWDNVELRVDEPVASQKDLHELGFRVGDYVGVDSTPEVLPNGFINARHLDDKAGVAALLAAAKYLAENSIDLPATTSILFTISEEVGSGASAVLTSDVAELVTIDNGTVAPGQESREFGITVAMGDSTGPFDYHLSHHLIHLCQRYNFLHARDVFRYYRCDSASALSAGNDTRTALIAFGLDASHGWERTNLDSLASISQLVCAYLQSQPLYRKQVEKLGALESFPKTRKVSVETITHEQQGAETQMPPPRSDS